MKESNFDNKETKKVEQKKETEMEEKSTLADRYWESAVNSDLPYDYKMAALEYEKLGLLEKAYQAWSYGASAAMDHGGDYKKFQNEARRVGELIRNKGDKKEN